MIAAAATKESCIALCSTQNETILLIINNWSRLYQIPEDIISMLLLFIKSSSVYSTGKKSGSGQNNEQELENEHGWNINKIEALENKYITKVACGNFHTLFLEENGSVWSTGYERDGRLGLGPVLSVVEKNYPLYHQDLIYHK